MEATIGTYGCLLYWLGKPSQYNRQPSKKNTKHRLYSHGVPPDDGLQMRSKHVEVFDEKFLLFCAAAPSGP